MSKRKVRLGDLIRDPKFQVRKQINGWIVSSLVQVLKAGLQFKDDIVVNADLHIVSGFHRYEAYKRIFEPDTKIQIDVKDFTDDDAAYLFAVQDNTTHGVPLEIFEKKEIRYQLRDNFDMSDSEISQIIGVSLEKFEKWDAETVIVSGDLKPLKSGNKHLAGQKMTKKQYENHRDHHTTNTAFHAMKIIGRIQDGTLEDDEETMAYLSNLISIVSEYLKTKGAVA